MGTKIGLEGKTSIHPSIHHFSVTAYPAPGSQEAGAHPNNPNII